MDNEQRVQGLIRTLTQLLRGLGGSTAVAVGFARGALEAVVLGGLAAFGVYVTSFDFSVIGIPESVIPYVVGAFLLAKRTAEGWADRIDPAKDRAPGGAAPTS